MTKKHFEALASELASVRPIRDSVHQTEDRYQSELFIWNACVTAIVHVCRESNVNFNREKFWNACRTRASYMK